MEKTVKFNVEGMTCPSCEKLIQERALEIKGVKHCKVDCSSGKGEVTFDPKKTSIDNIFGAIEGKGYECFFADGESSSDDWIGWVIALLGIALVGYFIFKMVGGVELPTISPNMGYGLLFLVGMLTGFHCVSMCGGFVVSYTAKYAQEKKSSYQAHLMYGFGKVVSYTIIGAAFGLLGSIITFTPLMRGAAGIIAGIFLILFGLKMLNIFPILRKVQFRSPNFLNRLIGKESEKHSSPLMIGLLNGLMIACGPLQAIYIMAAGTGSVGEGAKILFVFALGTLPVMLGFGYLTSFISSKVTHKILKVSGAIVIILGLLMLNNGLALIGTGYDFRSIVASAKAGSMASDVSSTSLNNGYQEIRMDVLASGWSPDRFVLKKGVPVKWIINGKQITGCNNAIQVPKLGLKFDIKQGEQVIEFTPTEEGIIPWSYWMGMIQGNFIVKENIDLTNQQEVQKELSSAPAPKKSGGCGCGGCGGGVR
ncbi:sulfite exporter TauE/SafE family protein [Candidatus Woesearchaeota archaeon]|nr:sulfite exporter TauE/SafE family protein [Candidatus Woesearchaeota archaeon]